MYNNNKIAAATATKITLYCSFVFPKTNAFTNQQHQLFGRF